MYPICKPRSVPRQPGITRRVDSPTPLHYAAADGDVATVNALLAGGADPNATAYFGMTPLHLVVHQYAWRRRGFRTGDRWAECARLLLEGGANPLLRCHPDTTPAGLGEGFVPPALRDAMVVLAERGVWRGDDWDNRERATFVSNERRSSGRTNFGRPDDLDVPLVRPGERPADVRHRLTPPTLDTLTASARQMEAWEEEDVLAVRREHVRIGWWTKRKAERHAKEQKSALEDLQVELA